MCSALGASYACASSEERRPGLAGGGARAEPGDSAVAAGRMPPDVVVAPRDSTAAPIEGIQPDTTVPTDSGATGAAPRPEPAAGQGTVTSALRKIPLLPWPFYGRRSLAALGPEGVLALPPRSPEHRLLEVLDPRECAPRGEPPDAGCLFLEEGRVYRIEREAGSEPPRFVLRPLEIAPEAFGAADVRVDRSNPERPLLVVVTRIEGGP